MRSSILSAFLLCASLSACERDVQVTSSPSQPEPTAAVAAGRLTPYPPARWRLSHPLALETTALWISHIVLRHRDVEMPGPCFSLADWHSGSAAPSRSREEALALARRVREQAAREPHRFGELARAHSEDVATQPYAGSLGGVAASQLSYWPEVLDAVAATPLGGVSEVVETIHGFHVFQRRPPPAELTVSGAHIVIAHDEAGWLRVLARAEPPPRARAEALALANEVYAKAKANPAEFSRLVEQYSSHPDAHAGGDMGTWSTREPSHYSREIEALAALAVGEVAPPMDSPLGIQIIQRTPDRARPTYAMDQVRLNFDPGRLPPDLSSEPLVLARARELAAQIRQTPARFEQLQREICCTYPEQWQDGRGSPLLTDALRGLSPGQIASEPVRAEYSYVIARRAEPATVDAAISYELPAPQHPDIEYFYGYSETSFADALVAKSSAEVETALGVPRDVAERIAELHRAGDRFQNLSSGEARVQAFRGYMRDVAQVLGRQDYLRYVALLTERFERVLLQQR